jgi:acetyl esterase/lipase
MKRYSWSAVVVALFVTAFAIAQQQRKDSPDIRVERDLVYGKGGDVELKLDLAVPKGEGPFPAILCIHGGGWRGGNRQDLANTIETFAGRGYVAATLSYRLVPAAKFPAQIEDCKAAVRWLRANASKYHVDPNRVGVMGFSAGGHLSCLLGTSDKNDGLEGTGGNPEQSSRVQAVVSFFGPTDFTVRNWSDELEENLLVPFIGGAFKDKPELYKRVSPIAYVTKDDPPFLFFHGTEDTLVSIRHSRILADKLQAVGVAAKVVAMEGEGHGWRGDKLRQSIDQTLAFFDEHLKK